MLSDFASYGPYMKDLKKKWSTISNSNHFFSFRIEAVFFQMKLDSTKYYSYHVLFQLQYS